MAGRKPAVSDDDLLEALADAGARRVTTSEVAERVSISRAGVLPRLRGLAEEGLVEREQLHDRGPHLWTLASARVVVDAGDAESARAGAGAGGRRTVGETAAGGARGLEAASASAGDGLAGDLEAVREEITGSGEIVDERLAAIRAAYELLQEAGALEKQDFIDGLYSEYPAGFSSERGWWNCIGKCGLSGLAERRADVNKPPGGNNRSWTSEHGRP